MTDETIPDDIMREAELASIRASLDAAEARAEKFLWQVRDTCARAEKAEAELATLRAENERLRRSVVGSLRSARAALKGGAGHA